MYWLHLTKKQKKRITQVLSPAEIQDPFADQSESLHWTALMITGTAETGGAIGYRRNGSCRDP